METKEKIEDKIEDKIEALSNEFKEILEKTSILGYSFFDTEIKNDSDGLVMKSGVGLRILIDSNKDTIGAKIEFRRGTHKQRPSDYAKITITYELSKGRNHTISFYDECGNLSGNKGSISGIQITDVLFNICYQLTSPIFEKSPMPMF